MKKILIFKFALLVLISCSSVDDIAEKQRELNQARQLWQSQQVENYKWNERLSCFCAGVLEWDLFVKDNLKEKVEFDEINLHQGQTYDDILEKAKTVEEAFDFIETLLSKEIASLIIEYDDQYGFPTEVNIDFDFQIADDETVYLYKGFEIIN